MPPSYIFRSSSFLFVLSFLSLMSFTFSIRESLHRYATSCCLVFSLLFFTVVVRSLFSFRLFNPIRKSPHFCASVHTKIQAIHGFECHYQISRRRYFIPPTIGCIIGTHPAFPSRSCVCYKREARRGICDPRLVGLSECQSSWIFVDMSFCLEL